MTEEKIEAKGYRDLVVWQMGIGLAMQVYELTGKIPQHEVYGLTNQLRRAAVSVPSNIAEGQARKFPGEFRRFLRIALGSLAEIDTQLVIATKLGYVADRDIFNLNHELIELRKKIYALINNLPE
jgi:four helix bundle protein